ncbi:hypothetical protein G647_00643 [Cladophialophora carrionii CBS 160.54]|uniref:Uncharacterized protein n=1 Tax=Cladophialophora carrionii CBS 160.54 TaxID=1279043 RepID=V9DMQ5_9EURO|nr:uncharacterized protein G647_00643 [Cladophialophora carrionii CBS 160.54]ETI28194.1 hypothetical protein G647_00643 [Cladophialophora carrionii CBS 160.54]
MATVSDRGRKGRSNNPAQDRPPIQERVGILSRTLTSSSSIRWILPARLRSPSKNDVVFVGHTFVQLHEFQDSGQLVDTTAQLDFGTTITDAKVISADLETIPVVDAILKQERDLEQFSIRGQPVGDGQPPQLLVLVTRDNEMIYVYARENSIGDAQLVFAKRPFLRGSDLPSSECRDVAVDPQSRALAVASPSGYVVVFKLRCLDEIKAEIDGWDPLNPASFCPAREQRFITVDGKFLLMSFLPSPDADPSKVVLLLLAYSGDERKEIYQYVLTWDTRLPLKTIKHMSCSGRKLQEDQLPTMLIPSTRAYSYMVVMPSSITYYENVQSSETKRVNCAFAKDNEEPLEWVQWSRPRRHIHYLQRRDDIVLLREDGLLRNFLFDKHSSKIFSTNNVIGHLGFSVDTAFCMLSGPPGKGGDILVVGGSMTDGGVFHVSARGSPERLQPIETLAPLNDIITGPPIAVDGEDITAQQGMPGRLYTCSGPHDRKGQVSEIRYGFEAQIGWKMEFPNAALVERLFSLELPRISQVLLLASHTASSSMVAFELETQDISFTDSDSHPGFDFDHSTLAATVFNQDIVIQVTTAGIRAILVEADDQVTRLRHLKSTIEHATISVGDNAAIAAVRACDTGLDLCIIEVDTADDGQPQFDVTQLVRLEHIPNSICCMQTHHGRMVVIGTATGELLCYDENLKPVFEVRIQDLHPEANNAAVSSLVALGPHLVGPTLLLCGLRSGTVLCVELKIQSKNGTRIDVRCDELFRVGATAVQIIEERGRPDGSGNPSALVLCEYTIYRVTLHANSAVVDFTFSPIWVVDRTNPSALPLVNALHRIPKLESKYEQPGGFLICATEAEILFCSVVAQEHGIARHLHFDGVPKRLLYSQFLEKFAVAYSKEGYPYEPPLRRPTNVPLLPGEKDATDRPSEKVRQIGLQLVTRNLSYPAGRKGEDVTFSTIVTGDSSAILHDFIDWRPTDDVFHYEWLVLALEQPGMHGRVVCVNAKTLGKGKPDADAKVAFHDKQPVTAICAYKKSSLLIACGKEIILRHLDFKTRRWETLSRHAIPSMANAISCQGSLICVATREHSLFVLVDRNDRLCQHKCDAGMRYAKDVAVLDLSTAVFAAADAAGTDIVGFSGLNKANSNATPLFHAKMPGHIHRFRLDSSHGSPRTERTRFYGATMDGTLFHFTLLKHKEWKLLHFIEEMSYMDRKAITAVPMKRRDADGKTYLWKPPPFRPKDMHVRGDRLLMMIEDGPYNLRNVLKGSPRLETFNALVRETLAATDEPVEVAIAWMRKFLRYPPRP